MESHSHERQKFESDDAKSLGDAQGLIAKAKLQSKRLGVAVDPITLAQRADDYPKGKINEILEAAILKEQGAISQVLTTSAATDEAETTEIDPRLTRYKEQYDISGNPKLKAIPWIQLQKWCQEHPDRLQLALEMELGGELFGVNEKGVPLFADGGPEPIMKGMKYEPTRDRVLYRHTSNDEDGEMILGENQKPISTGYEMFPYDEPYDKSDEITQYEAHTGRFFVQNAEGDEYRSSWLDSEKNPSRPRFLNYNPSNRLSYVNYGNPPYADPYRGVRRLLRGEENESA